MELGQIFAKEFPFAGGVRVHRYCRNIIISFYLVVVVFRLFHFLLRFVLSVRHLLRILGLTVQSLSSCFSTEICLISHFTK